MTSIEKSLKAVKDLLYAAYKRGYVAGVNDTLSAIGRKHGILAITGKKSNKASPRPKLGHSKCRRVSEKDLERYSDYE